MFTEEQVQSLNEPLLKEHVASRKNYGGGGNLSYLEQWHCIAEANRIFGFDGWDRETTKHVINDHRTYDKQGKEMHEVSYMCVVRVTVRAGETVVVREGTGYGNGQGVNPVANHELAFKEAESDAMKRALMTFGWPFGLALYDKEQRHVAKTRETVAEARQNQSFEKLEKDMLSQEKVEHLEYWQVQNRDEVNRLPAGWLRNFKEAFAAHMETLKQLEPPQ